MGTCDDCGIDYKGLSFLVPADVWVQISPTQDINGRLCPWCADKRLAALGIHTEAEVSLRLGYFDGGSKTILNKLAEIEHYRLRYGNVHGI